MDSGGGDANYWPGFVDALSNVVLTLVFVLVIFVFALVMASNKVEEKLKQMSSIQKDETVESVQLSEARQQIEIMRQQLEMAQDQLKKTEVVDDLEQNRDITVQRKGSENSDTATSSINQSKNKVSVVFPESTSALDDASIAEFSKTLAGMPVDPKASKVLIRSIQGNEPFTAAQRLAYYRVLSVRNYLMSVQGIEASRISSTIVKPDVVGAGRVEVIFSPQ